MIPKQGLARWARVLRLLTEPISAQELNRKLNAAEDSATAYGYIKALRCEGMLAIVRYRRNEVGRPTALYQLQSSPFDVPDAERPETIREGAPRKRPVTAPEEDPLLTVRQSIVPAALAQAPKTRAVGFVFDLGR